MRKIEESEKSPMSSKDFADYMRRNLEQANQMEAASKQSNVLQNNILNLQECGFLWKTFLIQVFLEIDTYMSALGFTKENNEGRYSNGTYLVWDVVPRNVLVDADGDIYVVDAEIKKQK